MNRRVLSVVFAMGIVLLLGADVALAQMGDMGMGSGAMGRGMMGGGGMGWRGQAGPPAAPQITEQRAGELAQAYADQHIQGYTVERVLPFTAPRGTAYSVELRGPAGQTRTLHVNPWGGVRPFDASEHQPG